MEETSFRAYPNTHLPPFDWDYPHARLRFFPVICRLIEPASTGALNPAACPEPSGEPPGRLEQPHAPDPPGCPDPLDAPPSHSVSPAGLQLRWVSPADLGDYEFPPANAALIARLRDR